MCDEKFLRHERHRDENYFYTFFGFSTSEPHQISQKIDTTKWGVPNQENIQRFMNVNHAQRDLLRR